MINRYLESSGYESLPVASSLAVVAGLFTVVSFGISFPFIAVLRGATFLSESTKHL